MRRTAIFICWGLTLAAAFFAGLRSAHLLPAVEPSDSAAGRVRPSGSEPRPAPAGQNAATGAVADPAAAGRLDAVRRLAAIGHREAGMRLLESHLSDNPLDAPGLMLLSELRGVTWDAVEPLLAVLRAPPDAQVEALARRRLSDLVEALERALVSANDVPGLVALFEALILEDPVWDGHRARLVHWLVRAGRIDEAERLLRETGQMGVSDGELAALADDIRVARMGVPFERVGASFYARAGVTGRRGQRNELRLLVDTGATMTALTASALRLASAEATGRRARVRTANGTVDLELYRIAALEVGGHRVGETVVLALESAPADADGLLGMDVLDQLDLPRSEFPVGVPSPAGTP